MTDALTVRPDSTTPVTVTVAQRDLAKRTVGPDLTDAQFALFLYECARRNVHPLDRMFFPTVRKGRLTIIASIDYMRGRAAATRDHMGTDDAVFVGAPGDLEFAAS